MRRIITNQGSSIRMVLLTVSIIVMGLGFSGCKGDENSSPIKLARIDMSRMYGGWYLIATASRNRGEKGMVEPYDVYSKRPDGDIREDFSVRHGSFNAPKKHFVLHDWVRPGTNNAYWRVQIFWPINLPFLALYVDPQYRYVMFGEQNRKFGWIYSRTPTIPANDYQDLLARFNALGYDTSKFVKFVQTPDEIGQTGVWSEGVH